MGEAREALKRYLKTESEMRYFVRNPHKRGISDDFMMGVEIATEVALESMVSFFEVEAEIAKKAEGE